MFKTYVMLVFVYFDTFRNILCIFVTYGFTLENVMYLTNQWAVLFHFSQLRLIGVFTLSEDVIHLERDLAKRPAHRDPLGPLESVEFRWATAIRASIA